MNLTKLAQIANVSVSTVSKAFSDSHEISEQTREMIFKVARDNNCFDKYYKPKYQKKVIAVICPEMLGIHYSAMATYLEAEISAAKDTMVLSVNNFSEKKQNELIEYYTKYLGADGIIVIEPVETIKANTDIPIVQIGSENESKNVDCVNVIVNDAMDEALEYISSRGLIRIGFVGEKYAQQEYEYFSDALLRNKISCNENYICISNKRFYDAGYYSMNELIKKKQVPDVIFAAYSHIAVGIMQRLKEEKLSIPEDISLICMDDISSAPYSDIELSSIKMHLNDVCATALNILYQKIEKKFIKAKRSITISREFNKGKSIK